MSKQRFFKDIETSIKTEISKIVLKDQQYKCKLCNAKHNSRVIRTGSGYSDPLDDHELRFYFENGIKTIKIWLRVIQIKGNSGSHDTDDYQALCPHHTQQVLKEKIVAIKKKNIESLSNTRIMHIREIKNYIFHCTGKNMLTKDCIGLIMRLEQVLKIKTVK